MSVLYELAMTRRMGWKHHEKPLLMYSIIMMRAGKTTRKRASAVQILDPFKRYKREKHKKHRTITSSSG